MDTLPFVDDHAVSTSAPPEAVWRALLRTLRPDRRVRLPQFLTRLWGLSVVESRGDFRTRVSPGDSIPGFAVAECVPAQRLTLRGTHRFSRYELRFELEPTESGVVVLHARTFAAFPGLLGSLYRLGVIGSGAHRVVVRHMLRSVARRSTHDVV